MNKNLPRALILGSNGFLAKELYQQLSKKNIEIISISRSAPADYCFDLSDNEKLFNILQKHHFDYIFNCAGSFVNDLDTCIKSNFEISKHLLDSAEKLKLNSKIILLGSAAEYGQSEVQMNGIKEDAKLHPVSAYGLSKSLQAQLAEFYHRSKKLKIYLMRIFNLYGQDISKALLPGAVLNQVELYKQNKIDKISTGNLNFYRDYIDVKEACIKILNITESNNDELVFNIGSGKPTLARELVLEILSKNAIEANALNESIENFRADDLKKIFANIEKYEKLGFKI